MTARGIALLGIVCCVSALQGATKQETAFMSVWTVHAQSPENQAAVIAACQRVMDTSATLGEYLPVVKTLAGWHLLAAGKEADAVRVLESVLTTEKKPTPIVRYADVMARRWLSRLDIRKVDGSLKTYYAEHVEYPASLAPILSLPPPATPAKADRFGDAWLYRLTGFSRLTDLKAQRYVLYSKTLGANLSRLKDLPFPAYSPQKQVALLGRKMATPLTVEIETVVGGATERGLATEGNLCNGVRFLKLSSDLQFALFADSECDFWMVSSKR
ncbi:MAG: hypothetical protein J6U40_12340 [Kiritimatiellae bacterium]|nr:hypothetical protein [Kiritimatiellia bacterium]